MAIIKSLKIELASMPPPGTVLLIAIGDQTIFQSKMQDIISLDKINRVEYKPQTLDVVFPVPVIIEHQPIIIFFKPL